MLFKRRALRCRNRKIGLSRADVPVRRAVCFFCQNKDVGGAPHCRPPRVADGTTRGSPIAHIESLIDRTRETRTLCRQRATAMIRNDKDPERFGRRQSRVDGRPTKRVVPSPTNQPGPRPFGTRANRQVAQRKSCQRERAAPFEPATRDHHRSIGDQPRSRQLQSRARSDALRHRNKTLEHDCPLQPFRDFPFHRF